jgi:uncharacterized phage-like protein YoqJ
MSEETTFHIALTGHRPNKLAGYDLTHPFYTALRAWLVAIIECGLARYQHLTLHSGMALGADTVWAEVIVAMRDQHPGRIAFVAELPVMFQPSRWPNVHDRKRWQRLVDAADHVNVYAETYSVACLHDRNRGMIRPADLLLAVWDGTPGGTAGGVRIAQEQGIRIFRMTPAQIRARMVAMG